MIKPDLEERAFLFQLFFVTLNFSLSRKRNNIISQLASLTKQVTEMQGKSFVESSSQLISLSEPFL